MGLRRRIATAGAALVLAATGIMAGGAAAQARPADTTELVADSGYSSTWNGWKIATYLWLDLNTNQVQGETFGVAQPYSTDVRLYTNIWESCDGGQTWNMQDSTAYRSGTLAGPTGSSSGAWSDYTYWRSGQGCRWESHGWLTESGVTRLDAWSTIYYN